MSRIIGNTVGMGLPKPNMKQTDPSKGDYVRGKDVIPTKVSQLENDKGYLTEHQDISGKLDATELPVAVENALAQAKANGEFDGEDGVSPEVSIATLTHGHRITIEDATGTKNFDVMDGNSPAIGRNGNWFIGDLDTGIPARGAEGDPGRGVQSIARTSGNGAAGTVDTYTTTYTDGTTTTYQVRNGANGKTPVVGTDYFTTADKAEMVDAVIAALPVYNGEVEIV